MRFMPRGLIYKLSGSMVMWYYHNKRDRTELLHKNISKAYPNWSSNEVKKASIASYMELSKLIAEVILMYQNRLDLEKIATDNREAIDKLRELDRSSPNGIVCVTAHYGNWEMLGQVTSFSKLPVYNIVKASSNRYIDQNIITAFRERFGSRMIEHKGSMVAMVKALKSGTNISLMIDQMVQPPNGVPVKFFNIDTTATKVVATLKRKYNPTVVAIFMKREGSSFRLIVSDPIESDEYDILDGDAYLSAVTQSYYDVIEAQIREDMTQWLWLYNRWKPVKGI